MKLPPFSAILTLALFIVPVVSTVGQTTIFSNMGSPPQFYPSGFVVYGADIDGISASQIGTLFTPAESFQLTSVSLCLSALDTPLTSVNLHLLTGTAELPLNLVASVNIHDLKPTGGLFAPEMYTIDFLAQPTFDAGTPIWLVLTGEAGVVAWGANGTDTQGLYKTMYATDLTSWDSGVVALQPGFEITGNVTSNVPETSSTVSLLAAALSTMAFVFNRRRRSGA
jgi:hypothetical protein